jgi:putative transposase
LKLTSIQKKTFKIWSDHARYSYNKAINFINDSSSAKDIAFENFYDTKLENTNVYYSKLELRDLITPESVCSRIPWILQTPKAVREAAVFEARKNLKVCLTNLKNGHINHFQLRFKSKKNSKWTITVPHASINVYEKAVGIYEAKTTNFRIKMTEKIGEINSDCMIHFDGLSYFICVPFTVEKKTNSQNWFAALDPGSRKFQTVYCPDEETYVYLGERASDTLYKKLITLDNLLSNKNSKNALKIKKLRARIEHFQEELHWKSIHFLCNSYQNIYVPKLTKNNDIIKLSKRQLKTKTVRQMVVLGHCKFVEKLKAKAQEFTNVQVHVITEEYTSQKCLRCFELTKTKKELFTCNFCKFKVDRDILGSTNILLKNW